MESNMNTTVEEEIKAYETICRKLTDNFPFSKTIGYKNRESDPNKENSLKLNPDGTFEINDLFIGWGLYNKWVKTVAKGNFKYSADERKLTLNIVEFGEQTNYSQPIVSSLKKKKKKKAIVKEFSWLDHTEEVEKLLNIFKKIEIDNYFWSTKSFKFPWLYLTKLTDEPETWDFSSPTVNFFNMEIELRDYSDELNSLLDKIKILSSGQELATTLTEPLNFNDKLILYPNGTLVFEDLDYNSDRDGGWSWDGKFKCSGQWAYDASTKTIKLFYSNYFIENSSSVYLNVDNMDLPKEHETKDFYFESSFINSIVVDSLYGIYKGLKMALIKRK